MFKHKEDHKVTLQQLADINNSGLNQAHKWAHSDSAVDSREFGIVPKTSDSVVDSGDDTEGETQSMDDCLLDIATPDNNNQVIKHPSNISVGDAVFSDCDTPEPYDPPRDEHVADPLIQSDRALSPTQHPPLAAQKRREGSNRTCLVVCVLLTLLIFVVILAVVIFGL